MMFDHLANHSFVLGLFVAILGAFQISEPVFFVTFIDGTTGTLLQSVLINQVGWIQLIGGIIIMALTLIHCWKYDAAIQSSASVSERNKLE